MAHVLMFHGSADLYGSDQTIIDLVHGLRAANWRVDVALPHTGELVAVLRDAGAEVHVGGFRAFGRASVRPKGMLLFPFQLVAHSLACLRLIRALKPSIVHVNTLIIPAPAIGARLASLPLVWHVHEIMTRPAGLAKTLGRLVNRLASRVPCNSQATLDQLQEQAPSIARKALVIPNGVSAHAARTRAEVRHELDIPTERFVFLFVGRLNAWKGQELFVEAAARVFKAHPKALFLAAGDAPPGQAGFRENFQAAIAGHGFGDAFRWLGFHKETQALYSAANASVVPSLLPEPFGLVATEAMAAGLPVIAAAHGGLAEIVVHERTGLHVTPGDAGSLAQAMESLLLNPEDAQAMGQAGKDRQLEHYSVGRYQEQFLQLYTELLPRERTR